MSFSSDVKKELYEKRGFDDNCIKAELAALLELFGTYETDSLYGKKLFFSSENYYAAKKCFTDIKKLFKISSDITVRRSVFHKQNLLYIISLCNPMSIKMIFDSLNCTKDSFKNGRYSADERLVKSLSCKKAFLRAAFICSGIINDPMKFYHLEIVCRNDDTAFKVKKLMNDFLLDAKITRRNSYYIVYIKEGDRIADFLNLTGAHVNLMRLENIRIIKDVRNNINRKVNCETANITKTVSASEEQKTDIELIRDTVGFSSLPDTLRALAEARIKEPYATLKELGQMLNPPVGKSCVNHRFRKIRDIADKLRDTQGEEYNGIKKSND